MLRRILDARGILWMLIRRELSSRYAGSNIGALWNIIHPIVMILIYVAVFSKLMGAKMGADNSRMLYTIHLCAGMIPWLLFSEIVSRCSAVLVENAGLLKKMALPEEVLFLSVFTTAALVHGIGMTALIGLLLLAGAPLGPQVIFAYGVMLVLAAVALGIGMLVAVMNLLVRDVGQVVAIALQLGFWSLPIVYLPSILPERLQHLLPLNPIQGYFGLIQTLFGSPGAHFEADAIWLMTVLPFAALLAGLTFLRRHRSEILDAL